MNIANWVTTKTIEEHKEKFSWAYCCNRDLSSPEENHRCLKTEKDEEDMMYHKLFYENSSIDKIFPIIRSRQAMSFSRIDQILRNERGNLSWKSFNRALKNVKTPPKSSFLTTGKHTTYDTLYGLLMFVDLTPPQYALMTEKKRNEYAETIKGCTAAISQALTALGVDIRLADMSPCFGEAHRATRSNLGIFFDLIKNKYGDDETTDRSPEMAALKKIEDTVSDIYNFSREGFCYATLKNSLTDLANNLQSIPNITPRPSAPTTDRNFFAWGLSIACRKHMGQPMHAAVANITSIIFSDPSFDKEKLQSILKEFSKRMDTDS